MNVTERISKYSASQFLDTSPNTKKSKFGACACVLSKKHHKYNLIFWCTLKKFDRETIVLKKLKKNKKEGNKRYMHCPWMSHFM